jgi:CRISPR-associated protein Csd2
MQGLVTDVCLKRKVRNYILASKSQNGVPTSGYDIYVKEAAVLNREHQRAYDAKGIEVGEPKSEMIPAELVSVFAPDGASVTLPEGFSVEAGEDDNSWSLTYSGALDAQERKEALKLISDELGKKAKDFVSKVIRGAKSRKPSTKEIDSARKWMCQQFFDIRSFGAVMSTGVNCGQVRGPIQMTFARSVDPVVPLDLSITRMAVTREEDAQKERGMGRKALIPYGLYKGFGFFVPSFAEKTGASTQDLSVFWEALQQMWDLDRSASRGMMACRGLYIFSHDDGLGNAPAHALFERVKVHRNDGIEAPRSFSDYSVTVDDAKLPENVSLHKLVG